MEIKDVHQLAELLRKEGFTCLPITEEDYEGYNVRGKGIRGAFCEPNEKVYINLNGRIAVDNIDCFNKYSQCPVVMKFPLSPSLLLKHLKLLGSKKGYEISNGFGEIIVE